MYRIFCLFVMSMYVYLCSQIRDVHSMERSTRIAKELSDLSIYVIPAPFDERSKW